MRVRRHARRRARRASTLADETQWSRHGTVKRSVCTAISWARVKGARQIGHSADCARPRWPRMHSRRSLPVLA